MTVSMVVADDIREGRRGAGRPLDMTKRDAILDAAEDVFAREGYGASMDRVAEVAGVSKQTIYKHFSAKDRLFDAMVVRRSERMTEPVTMGDPAAPPAEVLTNLGLRFLELMVEGQLNCLLRTMLSAGAQSEMSGHFYQTGPAVSLSRLGSYLKRQHDEGRLSIPDPMLAAEQFFGLMNGHVQLRGLLGVLPAMGDAERQARVDAAVRVFMAAYGR
ncbi:TetR/AcrR family transcriptional regulator [Niveispirillum cyanobacteriorum]|nr:TetR/AcrR family transcriptional regulator [Niveispirillum cyanobacteriorum]GGE88322.1 TetR family transcriptional regulator [Niveispirillum cyanobacteriorum]